MCNVTKSISQAQPYIIKYSNLEKFKYDAYLAISKPFLLSYIVGIDA